MNDKNNIDNIKKIEDTENINEIVGDYKYGFRTEAKDVIKTENGLSLDVV